MRIVLCTVATALTGQVHQVTAKDQSDTVDAVLPPEEEPLGVHDEESQTPWRPGPGTAGAVDTGVITATRRQGAAEPDPAGLLRTRQFVLPCGFAFPLFE